MSLTPRVSNPENARHGVSADLWVRLSGICLVEPPMSLVVFLVGVSKLSICFSKQSSCVARHYATIVLPLDLGSPSRFMRQFAQRGKHGCAMPFPQAISTSVVVSRQYRGDGSSRCILCGSQYVNFEWGYKYGVLWPNQCEPHTVTYFPSSC